MNRYIIDKRNGILAVIDTANPFYHLRNPGLICDEPWVVAFWDGDFSNRIVKTWKEQKAEQLCNLLNGQQQLNAAKCPVCGQPAFRHKHVYMCGHCNSTTIHQ